MRDLLLNTAMRAVDATMAALPRSVPDADLLRNCKIISHRGEHDNVRVFENTLSAFADARAAGVWGLECDIRWTADLVPVILHDPDGSRLFGDPAPLAGLRFEELRRRMPLVPSLAELVSEFGGNTHLMLEVKAQEMPDQAAQKQIFSEHLQGLEPGLDYHFLVLDPELLERVDFVAPRHAYLVAETNVARLSRAALAAGCGGLTGHYLLLSEQVRRRHEAVGQRIGTGFIASRACMLREVGRGIEWLFSNDAVALQAELDALLGAGAAD